jgi:hypothetical protein
MAQYDIALQGGLCGNIWWPNARCGKDISIDLSRKIGRFTDKPTMRDLLLHVLMERGVDFQTARFTEDTEIVVTREKQSDNRRSTQSRYWPITAFKSVSDLVEKDTFTADFCNEDF